MCSHIYLKMKSDLFYQQVSSLWLFCLKQRLVSQIELHSGHFHNLNELNQNLRFDKNIFNVLKMKAFSEKNILWAEIWIDVNNSLIFPHSFQVYLVKQSELKVRKCHLCEILGRVADQPGHSYFQIQQ